MTTSLLLSRRKPHRFTIVVQLDLGVEEGDGAGDVISTEGTSRLWVPRGCRLVLYRGEERVDETMLGGVSKPI
uniref:Wsv512 n=1 Tax=White spot syndrome virus TaxID=92652 RepID=A0A2U9GIS2_WSSV|nr:wsv512 [Shrimp white spot syndrome virus]AWQ63136.1 wsv512 [Shrimp white spot syndrome virus]AWQ63959.1 wsv512 [Shrimp white spot syndrome virus]